MFRASYLLLFALLLVFSGACEKKKTAAQLNAEREKVWQQQQKVRAAKYYQDLIDKFPDSPHVAEAKARLLALGPVAAPKAAATAKPAGSPKPGASPHAAGAVASPQPKS